MAVIAVMNATAGAGRSTVAHHLAAGFAARGARTVLADVDPRATLTSALVASQRLATLFDQAHPTSLTAAIRSMAHTDSELFPQFLEPLSNRLWLAPGDVSLGRLDDCGALAQLGGRGSIAGADTLQVALGRVFAHVRAAVDADVLVVDTGASLGAVTRAAVMAADYVLVPVSLDVVSVRGLELAGLALAQWRAELTPKRRWGAAEPELKPASMGYVVQGAGGAGQRVGAASHWQYHLPVAYRMTHCAGESVAEAGVDRKMLGQLSAFPQLWPVAFAVQKPMFELAAEHGLSAQQVAAAQQCRSEYFALTTTVAQRAGVVVTQQRAAEAATDTEQLLVVPATPLPHRQ